MMNSSQIESSDSNSQDRIDFQRFQGIWNNIKKAKQSSGHQSYGYDKSNEYEKQSSNKRQSSNRKSIISVKKAIQQEQQKNIQTRLILTQKQLKKAKQNTNLLLKKLSQAQQQIQYLEYELQKQIKQKQQMAEQIYSLKQNNVRRSKQNTIDEQQKQTLRQTSGQIQKLNKKIQFKQRQVDKLNLKIKSLELNLKNQSNQINLLNENNRLFQKKLQETQRSILNHQQNSYLNLKGPQLLQLQEAYSIIERLTILLRNTEEYKSFALSIQNFRDFHFLKNIQSRMKKNELIQKAPSNKRMCSCMQVKIDQNLVWTPAVCYKKVLQLKIKYGDLSQQFVQELLFQLNKIYLSKQENTLKNIRQIYDNKISQLKKKTQLRYDQLVARKQIERLKKQVQTQKYGKNKTSKNPQIKQNLQMYKAIGQYQDQLRLKQKQIFFLKQRIRLIQTQNGNYDKILYLEGTLWILDKILLQIENNTQDIKDFQNRFREKINQEMNQQQWINSFKYLFENINEIQNNLIQKLLMMKESTVKKMGNQKNDSIKQSTVNLNNTDHSFKN